MTNLIGKFRPRNIQLRQLTRLNMKIFELILTSHVDTSINTGA